MAGGAGLDLEAGVGMEWVLTRDIAGLGMAVARAIRRRRARLSDASKSGRRRGDMQWAV